jgi:protein SEY1
VFVGTLLNLLFGTTFAVMDANMGRTQTTQGVWMGRALTKAQKEETILVFDVEGVDSRERGDQHAVRDNTFIIPSVSN